MDTHKRKYEDALERARKLYEQGTITESLGYVFPELKESEDERIRKEIIRFIRMEVEDEIVGNKWLAWLEKQGEHANFRNKIQVGDKVTRNIDGVLVNLSQLKRVAKPAEKQGEPTEINPSEFDLRLNRLLKQFETLPKEELASSLSFYLNVVQNNGTYNEEKQAEQKLPIEKLPEEMKTIGESLGFTSKEICDKYNQMVSDLIMSDDDKGEQKPTDKAKPKFRVGDWITNGKCTWKIDSIDEDFYYNNHCGIDCGGDIKSIDEEYHLWTIADAKDGDILVFDDIIMIFKNIKTNCTANTYILYCDGIAVDDWCDFGDDARPATKEQRDTLFAKMHETGYIWDSESKQLLSLKAEPSVEQESSWSEEDKDFMYDTLSNLTELKDRYGEGYGNVGKCIDWLKSLKERI